MKQPKYNKGDILSNGKREIEIIEAFSNYRNDKPGYWYKDKDNGGACSEQNLVSEKYGKIN